MQFTDTKSIHPYEEERIPYFSSWMVNMIYTHTHKQTLDTLIGTPVPILSYPSIAQIKS